MSDLNCDHVLALRCASVQSASGLLDRRLQTLGSVVAALQTGRRELASSVVYHVPVQHRKIRVKINWRLAPQVLSLLCGYAGEPLRFVEVLRKADDDVGHHCPGGRMVHSLAELVPSTQLSIDVQPMQMDVEKHVKDSCDVGVDPTLLHAPEHLQPGP